jgi:hypothetical protein
MRKVKYPVRRDIGELINSGMQTIRNRRAILYSFDDSLYIKNRRKATIKRVSPKTPKVFAEVRNCICCIVYEVSMIMRKGLTSSFFDFSSSVSFSSIINLLNAYINNMRHKYVTKCADVSASKELVEQINFINEAIIHIEGYAV